MGSRDYLFRSQQDWILKDLSPLRKSVEWLNFSSKMNEAVSYLMAFGAGVVAVKTADYLSSGNYKNAAASSAITLIALASSYTLRNSGKKEESELVFQKQEIARLEKLLAEHQQNPQNKREIDLSKTRGS